MNTKEGKKVNIMLNRNLFARLLVIAKSRQVDLQELLSYGLDTYPLSLSTTTGGQVKTCRSIGKRIGKDVMHYILVPPRTMELQAMRYFRFEATMKKQTLAYFCMLTMLQQRIIKLSLKALIQTCLFLRLPCNHRYRKRSFFYWCRT